MLVTSWAFTAHSAQALSPQPPNPGRTISAIWLDPAIEAQGWVVELLPGGDRLLAYWYGFDDDGELRWLYGTGERVSAPPPWFIGDYFHIESLYSASGGVFGPDFNPDDVVFESAGSATLGFTSCDTGLAELDVAGLPAEQNLQRLTRTMSLSCNEGGLNGIPGLPIQPRAGLSGTWFDPAHRGEGITLQWLQRDEAVLYWYTYDDQGNPYWVQGLGTWQEGRVEFPRLVSLEVDMAGDTPEPRLIEWGELTLEMDCSSATMSYDSPLQGFGSGTQDLQRLTSLHRLPCPADSPSLVELYDITLQELPTPTADRFVARDVADDGTVVGVRDIAGVTGVLRLPPDEDRWVTTLLNGLSIDFDGPLFVSPGGEQILAGQAGAGEPGNEGYQPLAWEEPTGWAPLPGFEPGQFRLLGASQDRSQLVGTRLPEDDQAPAEGWRWGADTGLQILKVANPGFTSASGLAASNDGLVVIGEQSDLPQITTPPPGTVNCGGGASLWLEDGAPGCLLDDSDESLSAPATCSDDCLRVFGAGRFGAADNPAEADPEANLAWYWGADGGFIRLDRAENEPEVASLRYRPTGTSENGSLVVGLLEAGADADSGMVIDAFVWTQRSGTTLLSDLLVTLGRQDLAGHTPQVVTLDLEGERILVSWAESVPSGSGGAYILHLD